MLYLYFYILNLVNSRNIGLHFIAHFCGMYDSRDVTSTYIETTL